MKKILYVGGFELPEGNAAAQRVLQISKILRDLNNEVIFYNRKNLSESEDNSLIETEYFGFKCYEEKKITSSRELLNQYTNIKMIKEIIVKEKINLIIAYNFPSIATLKLIKYCRKRNIKVVGDITEWYGTKGLPLRRKIIKGFDSNLRMLYTNKKLDGLIVISDFLENYYYKSLKVKLPPMVDLNDSKWEAVSKLKNGKNKVSFIYAGSPSSEKENLDLIVEVMDKVSLDYNIHLKIIGITKNEYFKMYKRKIYANNLAHVEFKGRIEHSKVIENITKADYSIIIRPINRVTLAGFPTKLAESITARTPVLINQEMEVTEFVENNYNGFYVNQSNLEKEIESIILKRKSMIFDNTIFNYTNFYHKTEKFIDEVFNEKSNATSNYAGSSKRS
ncbi:MULTISPECIES: glycosyltransferase [unclassified Enterococcus]|uniref:glycosyltransferase n=2 Tax=Enterococcus TaxID=1350 RepID=UPI001903890A|nr:MULTISPECIES: glycosyltransferase [unclassified Enterococcus]MBK0070406.1 glycosyltransferase [Enterococcus sp. S53]MBK0140523.1 glycosyltransferase [Enterococcus sp. S76]MBK0144796.1 glycosyltransferase [Enterococcus sp. S77]